MHLQTLGIPIAKKNKIKLLMARVDTVYPYASGNKFYKLQPHFHYAKQQGIKQLISFGGAYSNHIHALAFFGRQAGFKTIGIIRGDPENAASYLDNPTLSDAQAAGMQLRLVSRQEYRCRYDKDYINELQQQYPDALIIPEGGSSQLAIGGCAGLAREINAASTRLKTDIMAVACGTGATLAGLACGLSENQSVIGYAVLRDKSLLIRVQDFIQKENGCAENYQIQAADFGGYAKLDKTLLDFIFDWLTQTGILLDPVYTGKMCRRLMQQIEAGEFAPGTSITVVHSGGLQGWRGMQDKVIKLSGEAQWDKIAESLLLK